MADTSKKRKAAPTGNQDSKRARFPGKPHHNIRSTPTTTAYPNGELNVSRFMRAHENEIKSLEKAMVHAKKGMMRRAFQDVPRDLRRRTASHNPQRVPKRLRMKAKQEAKDDNTPVSRNKSGSGMGKKTERKTWLRRAGMEKRRVGERVRKEKKGEKDPFKVTVTTSETASAEKERMDTQKPKRRRLAKLAVPPLPASRFRRRQVHKTWLPTHVWHSKRATLTPSKEPLWRFAVPLTPAVKSYRLTHRAAIVRGAVAWDMSYMATIGLEGTEASIVGLLKGLHFADEDGNKPWQDRGLGKKWRAGTRMWEGWIHEREGALPKKIAQVSVIWSAPESTESVKRKLFIRVHPSAFLQLWNEVIRISKVQKPSVTVEDLRFEVGSIEITGPAAAETLCSVLTPSPSTLSSDTPQSIWPSLASVSNAGVLPPNAIMAFPCSDPRLRDPPKTAEMPYDPASQDKLTEILADWPVDNTLSGSEIFNRNARLAAGRSLPSQKSINRRKTAAPPGQYPEPRSTDAQIPMLTYISTKRNTWTVLLPWKCVMPVWRGIMRYPVSTGGNPRFGGINELRQVSYERSRPCFPFDCQGTDAGWDWELQQRVRRKEEWTKRPRGKRIEWATIDLGTGKKGELGDPWECAWERLLPTSESEDPQSTSQKADTISSPLRQLHSSDASELLVGRPLAKDYLSAPHVFTAKISMVQKGVPTDCARIYRLPTNNDELRKQWLALLPNSGSKPSASKSAVGLKRKSSARASSSSKTFPDHLQTRALAASLLDPTPKAGEDNYPCVPGEEDLIGFVTTGNYNLAEGMPTAVANLVLQRVVERVDPQIVGKPAHVCIVREAGQTLGRLATWVVV